MYIRTSQNIPSNQEHRWLRQIQDSLRFYEGYELQVYNELCAQIEVALNCHEWDNRQRIALIYLWLSVAEEKLGEKRVWNTEVQRLFKIDRHKSIRAQECILIWFGIPSFIENDWSDSSNELRDLTWKAVVDTMWHKQ